MSNDKRKSSEWLGSQQKGLMFSVRESYRSIRTNINLFLNKSGCKKAAAFVFICPQTAPG